MSDLPRLNTGPRLKREDMKAPYVVSVNWVREVEGQTDVTIDMADLLEWLNEGREVPLEANDVTGRDIQGYLESNLIPEEDWFHEVDFEIDRDDRPIHVQYRIDDIESFKAVQ